MRNKNPIPTTTSGEEKSTFVKSTPRTMPSAQKNLFDFINPPTPSPPPIARGGSQVHTQPNSPFGHRDFAYTPNGHNPAQLSRGPSPCFPSLTLAMDADSMADTPGSDSCDEEQGARCRGEMQGGVEKSRVESWEEGYEESEEDEYVKCAEKEGGRGVSAAPGMIEERGITEDDRNAFAETVMYFERRITTTGNQAIRIRKDINSALEEMKREQERRSGMWSREQIDHLTGSIFSAFLVAACMVMLVAWATMCLVSKI